MIQMIHLIYNGKPLHDIGNEQVTDDPAQVTCSLCKFAIALSLNLSNVMSVAGRKGGAARTAKKARTARENGKRGGRPKKH